MPTTYYRLNGGRLTLDDCWRMARNWRNFLTLLLWKPVGGYPFGFSISRPEEPSVVPLDELPSALQDRLRGPVGELLQAGFLLAFYQLTRLLEPHRVVAGAVLLDPTGLVIANVSVAGVGRRLQTEWACTTRFVDGTAGVTSTRRSPFRLQPDRLLVLCPRASPTELYARHQSHLVRWEAGGHIAAPVSRARLPEVILEAQQRYIDFHVARGLFVPMTEAEIEQCRRGRLG
jgi:hypothetical protein